MCNETLLSKFQFTSYHSSLDMAQDALAKISFDVTREKKERLYLFMHEQIYLHTCKGVHWVGS